MTETLVSLSDRWDFTILLFVSLLAASQWPRIGRHVLPLLFPALLLLLRKLALFMPISGSISTEDQVFFWSTKAYWHAFILLLFHGLGLAAIGFRNRVSWESLGCLYFIIPVVLIAVSAGLLPLTGGASYFYSPVIALIGASKLLIVSPLLLPLAWLTLLLQTLLLIFAPSTSGREVNKLLLACVVISALISFGLQRFASHPAIVSEIQTWETENERRAGTTEFLALWVDKLPQTAELRVNLVEKRMPKLDRNAVDEKIVQSLNTWWANLWPRGLFENTLLCGFSLLLLFIIVERLPISDRWEDGKEH